jgi:hypothetical protein
MIGAKTEAVKELLANVDIDSYLEPEGAVYQREFSQQETTKSE